MYTLSDYITMIEEGNNTVILFNRVIDLIQRDLLYKTTSINNLINYMENIGLYVTLHDYTKDNTMQFACHSCKYLYVEYEAANNGKIKIIDVRF
ncbi:hypothetical protein [uncultured Megamonas sp.]|uniref:hypothetical protein n=1 Tax=uncultured Megamonas sp. TaxID=286140 RepID=UPI00267086B8|nr:hypothetical protein [uncultured Megamonas sp.]